MLGNIEDIKDYHRKVLLPKMEEAVGDSKLMRYGNTRLQKDSTETFIPLEKNDLMCFKVL